MGRELVGAIPHGPEDAVSVRVYAVWASESIAIVSRPAMELVVTIALPRRASTRIRGCAGAGDRGRLHTHADADDVSVLLGQFDCR